MKVNSSPESRILLLILIPLSLVILFAVINFAFMAQGRSMVSLDLMSKFGYDFRDFHWAGRYYLQGKDPWSWERFVTPPLSVFLVVPLSGIPARVALQIFFVLNSIWVLIGAFLFYGSMISKETVIGGKLAVLVSVMFSYPVFFLLHRGNIDGMVFFFISLGLYLTSRYQNMRADLFGSLCFAVACHLKIYPILLILPILIARRWRLLFLFLFWAACLALLTADMWNSFYQKILIRESGFKIEENGSLVNTIFLISVLLNYLLGNSAMFHNFMVIKWTAYLVFVGLLGLNIFVDYRQRIWEGADNFAEKAIMYLPFMICLPNTVFHYEFILLLALIPVVIRFSGSEQGMKAYLYLMAFGVVLSQIHAGALYFLTDNILAYYVPGFGLLLIMIANLAFKFGKQKIVPRKMGMAPDAPLP